MNNTALSATHVVICPDKPGGEEMIKVRLQGTKEHYLVDVNKIETGNYVNFYNDTCDYKIVYGSLVKAGYSELLESALQKVTEGMSVLWKANGRDFI